MSDPAAAKARWGDLSTRIISALVLAVLAAAALWAGAWPWAVFVIMILCAGFWELAALCRPEIGPTRRLVAGLLPLTAALPLLVFSGIISLMERQDLVSRGWVEKESTAYLSTALMAGLALPLILGALLVGRRRLQWGLYAALLLLAGAFLIIAREDQGLWAVLALIGIVVISDVAGYFAGRALGGPKFWPAISPKKTWSGTLAGWIGAAIFGAFVLPGFGVPLVWAVPLAVALCFAGQMGDIVESAMKRRAGIKDSSNLIPGHGGVLDRMDAIVGAAALAALIALVAGI